MTKAIIAIADNNAEDINCIAPDLIREMEYDAIVVCVAEFIPVFRQLVRCCSVAADKIDLSFVARYFSFEMLAPAGERFIAQANDGVSHDSRQKRAGGSCRCSA